VTCRVRFFGLVAVVVRHLWQLAADVDWLSVGLRAACGLLAVALLVANNLRDIPRGRDDQTHAASGWAITAPG